VPQLYELNLRDYWNIFLKRRRLVIAAFLAVFLSIFIYTAAQTPLYKASVLVKVDPYLTLPSDVIFPSPREYWMPELEMSDYTKQLVSRPIIEQAAKELGWIKDDMSDKERDYIVSAINDDVSADAVEQTHLIRLYATSRDPYKAAEIANKITEVFKRVNREQKNQKTHGVRVFIEETLADTSAKLREQEERLRVLTTQGAVGVGVNIINQIYELDKRETEISTKFTEKHPDIMRLREQIASLKDELSKLPKEEFEYGILKRDTAINEGLYTNLKQRLNEAMIKEAEKVDNVILVSPAIPSKKPVYPNKPKNYMIGLMFGLLLGVTAAMVTEHLDTSIGKVEDIESFIKVGVLGVIPFYSVKEKGEETKTKGWRKLFPKRAAKKEEGLRKPHIDVLEKGSSLFLEAFRILSVNLQVMFGKGERIKNKILMITSCNPEEGKSLISSNLAVILAQLGYKVLLLDADTRRANVHKIFGLSKKEGGLTDILMGKLSADSAIKTATDLMLGSTGVENVIDKPWLNNLNIITSGSVFPNTINLFNSEKTDETLKYFRNKYDVVIIDSSPILAVSEPSILVPKTDGVLLVYKAGSTSRLALRRAKTQIESVKGKGAVSGVILNNVTPEIGMDTYYYYNRKYYGEDDKAETPGISDIEKGKGGGYV